MDTDSSTKKKTRKVYIKSVFLKIEDINTIQETFNGLVFIRGRWREPSLDSSNARELTKINWEALWNPKLEIYNVRGEAKQQIWKEVQFGPGGEAFVLEKRRTKGVFAEPMELQEFPFDIQDLSVLITSDHPEEEIELEEDEEDMSNVVTHSFVDESEWHLKKFVQCEPRVTEDEYERNKYKKPGLFFRCCVIRRAGFFIWNIMLIMSIISALSFVTFADRYILGSMIFLFLVAGWHGLITLFDDEDDAAMDFIAFICFICLYIVLHVVFLLIMVVRGFSRRSEVRKRERDYLTRFEETHKNDSLVLTKRRLFGARQRTRVGIRVGNI
ncbi:hypothetical protein RRG08_009855 [Elysia crispata]|uniref:Neurotransmitter-gated ion-channel ligand-binding domain-containing protein n=1 Tax=Elysia crispata TaxID=231223 RepID=A0AAE1D9Q5_9GAST|nr:hypothetical protein RRG08_009855 [Elysia crispata]